jgi:phosphoribosylamine---glycine ligase
VEKIYFAPGNGGTEANVPISLYDFDGLLKFAKDNSCLTLVGPEKPLDLGIVDLFVEEQLPIFGPNKMASKLESSKVYAKNLMHEYGIPTAPFSVFSDPKDAEEHVASLTQPPVVKLDGLAQGKGVVVSNDMDEAVLAVRNLTKDNKFENEGNRIIIENRLYGHEISFICLCDGHSIVPLVSSQDHKRVGDNDHGPNTGGMGAYSPAPFITSQMNDKIMNEILEPTLSALNNTGVTFTGFLYAGLIIEHSTNQPYVLEFNVRMGDPECQSIIPRMESDLLEYIEATIEGRLKSMPSIRWSNEHAVCVVMTSRGYPGKYETGKVIRGLERYTGNYVYIFHSGTVKDSEGRVLTNGGRVLSVTGVGSDIRIAMDRAYSVVKNIHWGQNDEYYRNDIGYNALKTNRTRFGHY